MTERSTLVTRAREFDYVELHWLEKTTGRPSHEWDIYIVKELIDNALDADEQWSRTSGGDINLAVELVYNHQQELDIYSLDIAVSNSAPFPTESFASIFDLTSYASTKSHYRYPSRGQQGNALKTILGIPYALRREFYGDYNNLRKPLEIETGSRSFDISFAIDEHEQKASLLVPPPVDREPAGGKTRIHVRIDRFIQENQRTTEDLFLWAKRFALLNPHVTFRWRVNNSGKRSDWDFAADASWSGRFTDTAPVHWYEYAQLRELLLAVERERGPNEPLARVLKVFAGFAVNEDPDGERAETLCKRLGFDTVGSLRLAENHALTLRHGLVPALNSEGRKISAEELGGLGSSYLSSAFARLLALKAAPQYRRIVWDDVTDPAHPFVLEIAIAGLSDEKRMIWTGLNNTPAYEDPFYTKPFYLPTGQSTPVFGLDGFLDAYGQTADQPILLAMHIICPNFAFQDFSKTVIDTRLFREPITETLHEMLTEYKVSHAPQAEDLEEVVRGLVPQAIDLLSRQAGQRYSGSQLLHAVRRLLARHLTEVGRHEFAEAWLNEGGSNTRLQGYLQRYTSEHQSEMSSLIQVEQGRLALPVHPKGFKAIPLSEVSNSYLEESSINKILLVSDPELEAIFIFNGLLTRFDAAILQLDDTFESCLEGLLPHLARFALPLALLHHATPSDCLLFQRVRAKLDESNLRDIPLFDLGLTPGQGLSLGLPSEPGSGGDDRATFAGYLRNEEIDFFFDQRRQMSLFSLPLGEMIHWLDTQFTTVQLASKFVPDETQLRTAALAFLKNSIGDWVRDRLDEITKADFLADQIMGLVSFEARMTDLPARLQEKIREEPLRSWRMVWTELMQERLSEILFAQQDQLVALINKQTGYLSLTPAQRDPADENF